MEAAKANHYRWGDWLEESPALRAEMMAHEIHRGLRESWMVDKGGKDGGGGESGFAAMKRQMGMRA